MLHVAVAAVDSAGALASHEVDAWAFTSGPRTTNLFGWKSTRPRPRPLRLPLPMLLLLLLLLLLLRLLTLTTNY